MYVERDKSKYEWAVNLGDEYTCSSLITFTGLKIFKRESKK